MDTRVIYSLMSPTSLIGGTLLLVPKIEMTIPHLALFLSSAATLHVRYVRMSYPIKTSKVEITLFSNDFYTSGPSLHYIDISLKYTKASSNLP